MNKYSLFTLAPGLTITTPVFFSIQEHFNRGIMVSGGVPDTMILRLKCSRSRKGIIVNFKIIELYSNK